MPYGVGRPRGGGGTGGGATTSAPTLITTLSSSPNAPSSFRSRQMPVNAPSLSPDSIGTLTSIVLPGSSAPTFTGLLAPSCAPLTKASSVSSLHPPPAPVSAPPSPTVTTATSFVTEPVEACPAKSPTEGSGEREVPNRREWGSRRVAVYTPSLAGVHTRSALTSGRDSLSTTEPSAAVIVQSTLKSLEPVIALCCRYALIGSSRLGAASGPCMSLITAPRRPRPNNAFIFVARVAAV